MNLKDTFLLVKNFPGYIPKRGFGRLGFIGRNFGRFLCLHRNWFRERRLIFDLVLRRQDRGANQIVVCVHISRTGETGNFGGWRLVGEFLCAIFPGHVTERNFPRIWLGGR
jgi:hypothetical protein